MATTSTCDVCNKSTLSLLLLRPSPIAKAVDMAPPQSSSVISDPAAMSGLLPAQMPTESRFALRLLRPGYVHIYIAEPPSGMKNWLIFRVTEQSDIVPESAPLFSLPAASITCSRAGHNAVGLKLLNIPQAHKIKEIWIAYSANLWNEKLRGKNKLDNQVMQKITLGGASANTFAPTSQNLKSRILECALRSLTINRSSDHDFPFSSLAGQVDQLAENLVKAAASHPKTIGKEIAVVLRDPVGIATELNALRLRRNQLFEQEVARPENAHPLNSSNALMGLKKVMLDENKLESYEQVSPLRTKEKFDSESWPGGTFWQELSPCDRQELLKRASDSIFLKPYKTMFERPDLGRVIFPDHDEKAAAWAKQKVEESWSKLSPHYDEEARANWMRKFTDRIDSFHIGPLSRYETDWRFAASDPHTLDYFCRHFDPEDPNDPLNHHSAGTVYARESHFINTPPPFTHTTALDQYLTLLAKPITDPSSVALRALVGNQQSLFRLIHEQLTGDAGAAGMRDKTYDLGKGLSELQRSSPLLKKYAWMGDSLASFSVGQLAAMTGAVLSAAARNPNMRVITSRAIINMQELWCIQQLLETATQGAVHGVAPKIPVLITTQVDVDEALAVLRARGRDSVQMSKTRIKKHRASNTKITLSLLTDTEALKAAGGSTASIAREAGNGQVKLGAFAAAAVVHEVAGSAVQLSEQQFLRLYERQSTLGTDVVNAVRRALSGNIAKDVKVVAMTLEGRLALGSIFVQALGLINGLQALDKAKSSDQVRDAWYGIYDSTGGLLGGVLQTFAVAKDARLISSVGESGAAKSIGLGALRFTANIAGAAGGILNSIALWAKVGDAKELGNKHVADFYLASSLSFAGTTVTSFAAGVGVVGETLVARGMGGAVARTIASRLGASAVLTTIGGTALTVSGIGLVLLGAGIAFQVGAVALSPTPLQRWIGRSYFGRDPGIFFKGKRDDMFRKGDWPAEFAALNDIIRNESAAKPNNATNCKL